MRSAGSALIGRCDLVMLQGRHSPLVIPLLLPSRSEGHPVGFDSLLYPPPPPSHPPPPLLRGQRGGGADVKSTASLPGLVSKVHKRLLITYSVLTGFLSRLLLHQQQSNVSTQIESG